MKARYKTDMPCFLCAQTVCFGIFLIPLTFLQQQGINLSFRNNIVPMLERPGMRTRVRENVGGTYNMNRIYSVIYSEARSSYVVVSELARRHGKPTHSCRRIALTAAVLAALASFSWAGMPVAQAADRTTPLVVTDKNQMVRDNFDVSVTDGLHDAVVDIPAAVSGGTVQVKSNEIKGGFTQPADENVMEANGAYIHGDYTGTVQFADGLRMRTTATGKNFNAGCIYLTGVEDTSNGEVTIEKTAKANAAYEKNGRVADAYGIVGKDTVLTLVGNPDDGDFLNMAALESHFAHMEVGDGLQVSVTTGPAKEEYASGLDAMFYGKMKLGNRNTITVSATANDATKNSEINAIYSSHDHPYDEPEMGIARQRMEVGDDTTLNAFLTSSTKNQSPVQVHGAFLDQTDFSFGDRLTINTKMTGSGKVGDGLDSVASGVLVWTSTGTIGDDFKDTVTFSDGTLNRVQGVKVNGLNSETDLSQDASLTVGKNSRVQVNVSRGTLGKGAMGYQVVDGAKLRLGDQAAVDVSLKDAKTDGEVEGINTFGSAQVEAGDNTAICLQMENSQVKEADGLSVSDLGTLGLGKYASVALQMENSPVDTVMGINVDHAKATLGDNASLSIEADGNSAAAEGQGIWGINASDAGTIDVGNGYRSEMKIAQNPVGVELVNASDGSRITMGSDVREILDVADSQSGVLGRDVIDQSSLSVGDRSSLTLNVYGDMKTYRIMGTAVARGASVTLGNDGSQQMALSGKFGEVVGNRVIQAAMTVGNHQNNIISITGDDSVVSSNIAGDELAVAPVEGKNLQAGNGYTTIIRAEGDNGNVNGMYAVSGAKASIGDGAAIDIHDRYTGTKKNAVLFGIRNQNAAVAYGSHLRETLTGENVSGVYGIVSAGAQALTDIGNDAMLQLNSSGKNTFGVYAQAGGQVKFTGGAAIQMGQGQDAIYSTGRGSSVSAVGNGRKAILGNLEAAKNGSIQLKLNTEDSYMVGDLKSATGGSIKLDLNAPNAYLRGKSTVDGFETASTTAHGLMATAEATDSAASSGDTEMTVANSARWDMTADSQLTKLDHENGGIVNMAYNPELQRLDVGTYSGKDGIFRMKSDLNELETAGKLHADKVYIDKVAEGSTGLIQVHDQSFLTGHEVTGTKYQLLVTDASGKATFSGLTLDDGGLWDVTPTIQNGKYVHDVMGVSDANEKQWYLTKLERSINKDTKPLIGAADYAYGAYRMDIETLRQRMGELRFLKDKKDESGIWARTYGGEFDGPGYDSRYHTLQLGYDYAANPKSFYGWFGERGIASPHYDYGTSSNHSLAAGIYGTWFGDSGVYTDAVAKWGRDDVNLHTSGSYPDKANYRTRAASLSLEYGKTMNLSDKGVFLEP